MRQAFVITLVLVGLTVFGKPLGAATGGSEILDHAKALVANQEYQMAATMLEEGLLGSTAADRREMVGLLRQTYQKLIRQAEASGNAREAAEYRDNLAILEPDSAKPPAKAAPPDGPSTRRTPPSSPVMAVPAPRQRPVDSIPIPRSSATSEQEPIKELKEPSPLPEPAALPNLDGPVAADPDSRSAIPPPNKIPARPTGSQQPGARVVGAQRAPGDGIALASAGEAAPSQVQQRAGTLASLPQPSSAISELDQADRWFTDKKYTEAGRAYARLAAQNQLPAQRKQVWAYCRWVAVVALINAHPQSDQEWDAIEQEVRSIQKLTPGNWYGEYLQNRVAEARRGARGNGRAGKMVVRGSAPEDDPPPRFPRFLGRARPAATSPPGASPNGGGEQSLGLPAASASQDLNTGAKRKLPAAKLKSKRATGTAIRRVPPGRLRCNGPARKFPPVGTKRHHHPPCPCPGTFAKHPIFGFTTRIPLMPRRRQRPPRPFAQQARRWGSPAARAPWSPPCDIYLYPTPGDFARLTGQPETSPGFSTMGVNGNRIVARRVNLRADHPQLLTAILPHEVTHVVLADLFTQQQIPRWADEGMAVLAEPKAEQVSRASELNDPLKEGRVFKLSELMAIDYPSAEAWNLYYAQSVSLTQFLVEQGSPERFVSFVRGAQRKGIEIALRESYQIDGFAELENRWQTFARRQAAEIATSSRDTPSTLNGIKRD